MLRTDRPPRPAKTLSVGRVPDADMDFAFRCDPPSTRRSSSSTRAHSMPACAKRVLAAIERIVNAEATASGAPRAPEITPLDLSLNLNDQQASARVVDAFRRYFPEDRVQQTGPAPASEDFGSFGTEWHVPSVFWFVGGTDPDIYSKANEEGRINDIPVNHSPRFAPIVHPTLETGVTTLIVAAQAWLAAA